jgi:tetratricopeptide (TPR) repeat protein
MSDSESQQPPNQIADAEGGKVAAPDDTVDARGSRGFVYKPRGPVTQYFGTVINGIDQKVFKRLGLDMRIGFALLGLMIIVIVPGSMFILYHSLRPNLSTCMSGDLRIAIASFSENGATGTSQSGTALAENIAIKVQRVFEKSKLDFTTTIWGPDRVPAVTGKTRKERATEAAKVAQRICADVVVYGDVNTSNADWQISPEFYISSEDSYRVGEVVGPYELGKPILMTAHGGSVASRITSSEEFAARLTALSNIVVGLSFYLSRDYERSLETLRTAENIESWENDEGKHVLYMLIASAAGKAGKPDEAEQAVMLALQIDGEYARAVYTLASIYYFRAVRPIEAGGASSDVDMSLLDEAIATYQRAVSAKNQPPLADIPAKVAFGLGQCYLARTLAGSDSSFHAAIAEFENVIREYGDGVNPRLKVFAGESHARLGLIYDAMGDRMRAAKEYDAAVELLDSDPKQQAKYRARVKQLRDEP